METTLSRLARLIGDQVDLDGREVTAAEDEFGVTLARDLSPATIGELAAAIDAALAATPAAAA
ncbi:MAG: hypothetical protein GC191_09390 [Azospirillum sp.]|nr:hypothetical protein [Azospirillum sp.]